VAKLPERQELLDVMFGERHVSSVEFLVNDVMEHFGEKLGETLELNPEGVRLTVTAMLALCNEGLTRKGSQLMDLYTFDLRERELPLQDVWAALAQYLMDEVSAQAFLKSLN